MLCLYGNVDPLGHLASTPKKIHDVFSRPRTVALAFRQRLVRKSHLIANAWVAIIRLVGIDQEFSHISERLQHMLTSERDRLLRSCMQTCLKGAAIHLVTLEYQ